MTETDHSIADGDWVVVKKQRITIIIPAAPPSDSQPTPENDNFSPVPAAVDRRRPARTIGSKSSCKGPQAKRPEEPSKSPSFDLKKADQVVPREIATIGRWNAAANLRRRADNLEKELEKSGGLRRWLETRGLGRLSGVFDREEKLCKYQMASLTMSKLKQMGAFAVGPRRKLIHAIDHLCQPS